MEKMRDSVDITKEKLNIKRKIDTKSIALLAMMGSVSIVLGYYSIVIGDYIKIGFSGIPNQIVSYLFGPSIGGIFGGVLDILKYIVRPTGPFFPGFTISGIIAGIIYGIVLHNKPITFTRILIAKFISAIIIDIILNTLWLSILYGNAFMVILPIRIIKTVIMLPIDTIILYVIMTKIKGLFSKNI